VGKRNLRDSSEGNKRKALFQALGVNNFTREEAIIFV
jgi:hypothetical protein